MIYGSQDTACCLLMPLAELDSIGDEGLSRWGPYFERLSPYLHKRTQVSTQAGDHRGPQTPCPALCISSGLT